MTQPAGGGGCGLASRALYLVCGGRCRRCGPRATGRLPGADLCAGPGVTGFRLGLSTEAPAARRAWASGNAGTPVPLASRPGRTRLSPRAREKGSGRRAGPGPASSVAAPAAAGGRLAWPGDLQGEGGKVSVRHPVYW